ncbi:MAG: hypothetical protein A07HR60_02349 [uncultured archaeon A07HR60]|nr:MAG: hypothetical protein A07HR60_02349 [uncultured archaeon A07HR60]
MTRRRSLIQKLGASVAGAGLLTGSAAAEPGSQQSAGEQITGSGQSDTPPAERDVMIGRSTQFDPHTISTDETSILHSRWDFQAVPPIPANTHQLDILVTAQIVAALGVTP